MPIFSLGPRPEFPEPERADPSGVLAVGGDLSVERLLTAYSLGIFPWPVEGYPLLWHAPPQRFVLKLDELVVNRSLAKAMRKHPYRITVDRDFLGVIRSCAATPRPGQDGTWITSEVEEAYHRLHQLGFAHSVEAWRGEELVGGLYGVVLGRAFFGESMFSTADNASKIALATLVKQLKRWEFQFVDAQVHTELFESLGCKFIKRKRFGQMVAAAIVQAGPPLPWQLDEDLALGWAPTPATPPAK